MVWRTAQLGEHPGVLVLSPSAACAPPLVSPSHGTLSFGTRHTLPTRKRETTSLGYFLDSFFFLPLSRSWLIKRPVWEKHALPRDASPEQRVSPTPAGGTDIGVPQPRPAHPPLARGRAGQGLFIDTALSRLPLPEETAPGGDGPDLAVLLDIPPGAVLSGNQRLPGVPPTVGCGTGPPPLSPAPEGSWRDVNLRGGTGEYGSGGTAPSQPSSPPGGLREGLLSPPGARPGAPCVPDGRQLLFPAPVAGLPWLPRSKVAAHMRQYSYGPN